jgi:methionyl-tRNA formyltransferase
MAKNLLQALFLTDASDIGLSCARSAAARSLDVLAVIVGPNVAGDVAEAVGSQFDPKPPIIRTARPDRDPHILDWMRAGKIDLLLSCFFEYRIRPELLNAARRGGINIHPSVLPHNGGFHTSFWGLVDNTPLGATLHWLDEGLDTGAVIAQKTFADDGVMTAGEVRARQRRMCAELFEENLDAVLAGKITRGAPCKGTYHGRADIAAATTFAASDTLTIGQLMRLGRATSHDGHGIVVRAADDEEFLLRVSVSRPCAKTAGRR